MTYIVINENEIVKAEMERPECFRADDTDEDCPECWPYIKHCLSLPRIPIQGKHNWKLWQEVKEGKDFTLGKQFLNENDEWQELHFFKSIWDDLNDEYKRVVAIPIQPTPEGENEDERHLEAFRGDFQAFADRILRDKGASNTSTNHLHLVRRGMGG